MAYSMDLRLKVLEALDRGESQASVARRFDLGLRTVNPIEKLWSKVKAWLRRAEANTLSDAVAGALRAVTPGECWNYFTSCERGQK